MGRIKMDMIEYLSDLKNVPHGGIKEEITRRWIEGFQAVTGDKAIPDFELTELQRAVANHKQAFGTPGSNLVITGPTSAGKTLIAEMLIANHLSRGIHPL